MIGKPTAAPVSRGLLLGNTISFAHLFGLPKLKSRQAARRSAKAAPASKPPAAEPRSSNRDGRDAKRSDTDQADRKDRAAALRERERCAAIFRSPAAAVRLDVAAHLAFNTELPRRDAIDLLRRAAAVTPPQRSRGSLYARMAAQTSPRVGDGDDTDGLQSANSIALRCLKSAGIAPQRRT